MKKKAIIIIISLLVLLAGIGAILWFFTPVFNFLKPASDNFSIQAKKLFGASKEVSYQEYIKNLDALKVQDSKSRTSETTISANVSLPSNILDSKTQSMINNTTIKTNTSYDANSKASSTKAGILYNNENVIDLKMVKDGKKITVESKDFYDKALTFDLDKLKEFCKKNYPNVPEETIDSIVSGLDTNSTEEITNLLYDLFYLTEDEYNTLHKDYGDIFKKFIDKDNFSAKKNQKVSVDGKEVKTTAYSLTISGKDMYKFINKLAKDAKNNDNLKSILAKKANIIKKLVGKVAETGMKEYQSASTKSAKSAYSTGTTAADDALEELQEFLAHDFDKSDIEKVIDDFIEAFEQTEEVFSEIKRSVKITIYSNKKSEPVRMDVAVVKNKDDDGNVIFTEELAKNKVIYTFDVKGALKAISDITEQELKNDDVSVEKIIIENNIEEKSDTTSKGKMKVFVKADDEKNEIASIDYEIVSSKSEAKLNFKIKSSSLGNAVLDFKCEETGLDSDEVKLKLSINGSLASYKVSINIDNDMKFDSSDITKYDDTNSVDVFTKSNEEIIQIINTITTKAADILPARMKNYGIDITREQILENIIPTTPVAVDPATAAVPTAA